MGEWAKLTAADGHVLNAYGAEPAGEPLGSVVIVQEIFGVNGHIRSVVDGYAAEGYRAVAPALFDRQQRGVELRYEGEDAKRAFGMMQGLKPETALEDIRAAFVHVKTAERGVAVIGFCYGGLMSWLSATRGPAVGIKPACCVGYYPGGVGRVAEEAPGCPVMLHFGANDSHIGPEQVEAVRAAHPEVTVYVYEGAEHGFNCEARGSYNPGAAGLARERTLGFLKVHMR